MTSRKGIGKTSGLLCACVAAAFVAAGAVQSAQAASVSFTLEEFTGDDAEVEVTIEDVGAGEVKVTLDVLTAVNDGDIVGVFFDINDESLLSTMSVSGSDVTDSDFDANNADVGSARSLTPEDNFDIAVAIGDLGATDFINSTMFTFDDSTDSLSLANFLGERMGVRLHSVGSDEEGSSKLVGTVIPAPATASAGLAMLGVLTLLRRRSAA